jgi:type II secretory pathway pseudopilin PulG
MNSRGRGFSLVEAAVAVAVMTILAGMMAPLALKILNQRRDTATRKSLKLAFEAMFGARDRRVGNMRADFGFDPDRSYPSLAFLVDRNRCGRVPVYGRHDGAGFYWGYNGPYWYGPVSGTDPVDAWGSPIGLVYDPDRRTVQVRSLGPGHREGAGNLFYPPVPAALSSFRSCVIVNIEAAPQARGIIQVIYGGGLDGRLAWTDPYHLGGRKSESAVFWVPSGGMEVRCLPDGKDAAGLSIPLDLLPGETREVRVSL